MNTELISFENRRGETLFGTFHRPIEGLSSRIPVVLLAPGVKMRVGPGRLYVPLTDALTAMGHSVLRFDFSGLGDSDGVVNESELIDVYRSVERGRYIEDTLDAIDWIRERERSDRVMLGGLCGGALTALLAAEHCAAVESILSLGMTVALVGGPVKPAELLTRAQLDHRRALYYRRLLEPKSWARFFSGKTEYGVLFHSILRVVQRRLGQRPPDATSASAPLPIADLNPDFPRAFLHFLGRGGRILLLFGEKDRLPSEYQEKFAIHYARQLEPHAPQIQLHIVPGANHVLSQRSWRSEMTAVVQAWSKPQPARRPPSLAEL